MRDQDRIIPIKHINKEGARELVPHLLDSTFSDPHYYTLEPSQDPVRAAEGWSDVVYYSGLSKS